MIVVNERREDFLKFMFSKKATKIDEIFTVDLTFTKYISVKSTVKILSIFVAFLKNMNFTIFVLSNIVIFKSFREYGRRL